MHRQPTTPRPAPGRAVLLAARVALGVAGLVTVGIAASVLLAGYDLTWDLAGRGAAIVALAFALALADAAVRATLRARRRPRAARPASPDPVHPDPAHPTPPGEVPS